MAAGTEPLRAGIRWTDAAIDLGQIAMHEKNTQFRVPRRGFFAGAVSAWQPESMLSGGLY